MNLYLEFRRFSAFNNLAYVYLLKHTLLLIILFNENTVIWFAKTVSNSVITFKIYYW